MLLVGVLRALGMRRFEVYRVFVYEAFLLVFSSSLVGALLGTTIGFTIVAQRRSRSLSLSLFNFHHPCALYRLTGCRVLSELPVVFSIDWNSMGLIVIGSLVCALLGTASPLLALLRKSIADTIRG
jgi:ABC-type antimicrobial peptide transport system permease subunit